MKKSTKTRLHLMGRIVTVVSVLKRYRNQEKRFWRPVDLPRPRAGWIVGFRRYQEGTYVPARQSGETTFADAYLRVENTIEVVLVSFWPSQKPVPVARNAFFLGGEPTCYQQYWK